MVWVPEPVCQTTRGVIVELSFDHLACGADDGAGAARIEKSEFAVGLGGGELDDAERMDVIGMRSWPILKFCRERSVCAPQ